MNTVDEIRKWYRDRGYTECVKNLSTILIARDVEELWLELNKEITYKSIYNLEGKSDEKRKDQYQKRYPHHYRKYYGRGDRKGTPKQEGKK